MSVELAVDIDSRMVLGGFLVNNSENGDFPVVLWTWVLYEDVSGCTYKSQSVW